MKLKTTLPTLALAVMMVAGCASMDRMFSDENMEKLDQMADYWIGRLLGTEDNLPAPGPDPTVPGPGQAPQPSPTQPPAVDAADAVEFAQLQWRYGGFNGANARLDSPRLSKLSIKNGNRVYYKWDVGLSGWGLGNDDAGAVCAIFFEKDSAWIGGKFDWVSTSRSNRELKHVESYSNWPSSGIKLPWNGRVAFVVVSADGRRRSNVLVAEAR